MTRDGQFAPDFDDEIVAAMCLTHAGELRGAAAQPAVPSPIPSGQNSTDGEFSPVNPTSPGGNSTRGESSSDDPTVPLARPEPAHE
jgi:hypothetical protein